MGLRLRGSLAVLAHTTSRAKGRISDNPGRQRQLIERCLASRFTGPVRHCVGRATRVRRPVTLAARPPDGKGRSTRGDHPNCSKGKPCTHWPETEGLLKDRAWRPGVVAFGKSSAREQCGPRCEVMLTAAPAADAYYRHMGFANSPRCWVLERDQRIRGHAPV